MLVQVMEQLSELDIHGIADNGAEFLDLGARGLKGKTEFFYRRGDGSSLYATRDIAYHIWKFKQCENLINILGEDLVTIKTSCADTDRAWATNTGGFVLLFH